MSRLLILCEFPTLLGGERSLLSVLPAVAAAGWDMRVAAPPDGPLAEAVREQGVPLAAWTNRDSNGRRRPLSAVREELQGILARQQPTLVHANSLSAARLAGPVAAASRISSLGHLRDIIGLSRQAMADINCNSRLVAVSQATRDYHVAQGLDASRCDVVHNGVDLDELCPRPKTGVMHRELGLDDSARLVATIGQLGIRKGTDVALQAASSVVADIPNVHWLLVGSRTSDKDESRTFEQRLHDVSRSPELEGHVHFLGTRNDVPTLLRECDLLVHAARQEPLGRVLLESAASGVAVVATDVGGTREIFPNATAGAILIPTDEATALANAVKMLLTDDDRRAALGAAGRRRAVEMFDARRAARDLLAQYELALASQRTAAATSTVAP